MNMFKKRGQMWDTMIPWFIGVVVVVLVFTLYMVFNNKGTGLIQFLKDLFRFG